MNGGSQENNKLFGGGRPDKLTNVVDEHNGYHGLASACLQNGNGVSLHCNLVHLWLITTHT